MARMNSRKVKVFQVQVKKIDRNGNLIPREYRFTRVVCIGNVILPRHKTALPEETIWDMFNWTCWGCNRKYERVFGLRHGIRRHGFRAFPTSHARGFCNSDIFMKIDGVWRAAQFVGFTTAESYEDAVKKCVDNINF